MMIKISQEDWDEMMRIHHDVLDKVERLKLEVKSEKALKVVFKEKVNETSQELAKMQIDLNTVNCNLSSTLLKLNDTLNTLEIYGLLNRDITKYTFDERI